MELISVQESVFHIELLLKMKELVEYPIPPTYMERHLILIGIVKRENGLERMLKIMDLNIIHTVHNPLTLIGWVQEVMRLLE